jgi:hypothetical protein
MDTDTIEGVSIISVGEAKGHGLYIDMQTLREVKSCAETYAGGVKVNMDHGAGIGDIVGFVDNFRIVGEQLLGDLNLLKSAERRDYILEIADRLPDTFGISIAFTGPVREVDGRSFASCAELYSADLVQTPAANPTGLFSFTARVDSPTCAMEDQNTNTALEDGEKDDPMKEVMSRLDALESAFADYKKKMEEDEMPESKDEETSQESALSRLEAKLETIVKNFGAAPMKASAPAEEQKEEKLDLKALIEAKTSELGSKTAAIKFAMSNHPAEYIALRDSNQLSNL